MPKCVAIIPARGGSKRILKKNIKLFHGKPLIAYSIQTALDSNLFDKIVVSTDDKTIANIAIKYGAIVHNRPKELADDFTATQPVIDDVINTLKQNGLEYNYYCTIYATAPLLESTYLIEGFKKLQNSDATNAFSVTSMPFPIQRTFKVTSEGRCEMFTPEHFMARSQDLEEAYQDAGQFYWTKLSKRSDEIMFGEDSIPIILPRHLVQDIDTLEDWERAEYMYQALHQNIYDKWNNLKQYLNTKDPIPFKQGEIYFMSVGQNIGYEVYGHHKLFLRPVLIYRKLSSTAFIGIPLSSKEKKGNYYYTFRYTEKTLSTALLNQIKVFDIRRNAYFSGNIKIKDFKILEKKVMDFMKVTPNSKRKGSEHASKKLPKSLSKEIGISISKKDGNVK